MRRCATPRASPTPQTVLLSPDKALWERERAYVYQPPLEQDVAFINVGAGGAGKGGKAAGMGTGRGAGAVVRSRSSSDVRRDPRSTASAAQQPPRQYPAVRPKTAA